MATDSHRFYRYDINGFAQKSTKKKHREHCCPRRQYIQWYDKMLGCLGCLGVFSYWMIHILPNRSSEPVYWRVSASETFALLVVNSAEGYLKRIGILP